MQKVKYTGILLLSFLPLLAMAASIKGKLNCSDEWEKIAYLSVIQSFDDLHTASYDFLRYQVNIDSFGHFELRDLDLAKTDRIYRLHICKKGDPVSTIIIGGQEENFIHFLMNNSTDIEIVQETGAKGLRRCSIHGHPKGDELEALFRLQVLLNTPPELPSEQNRTFQKQQVLRDLREIADTSSNAVTKLLAVHMINENFAGAGHFSLMASIDKELTAQERSGPYYSAFSEQLRLPAISVRSFREPVLPLVGLVLARLVHRPFLLDKKSSSDGGRSGTTSNGPSFNQTGKTGVRLAEGRKIQ